MSRNQILNIVKNLDRLIDMKAKHPHKRFGLSDDDLAIYDPEEWNRIHKVDQKISLSK
jgi:hypothetical protein